MSQSIYELARQLRKNQTPAEKVFWRQVRKRKILRCLFLRQYVVAYPYKLNQNRHFITDFYCAKIKLVVEIDGGIHLQQIEYDKFREDILEEMHYNIIRFTNSEVLKNWESVEMKLRDKISELGDD